MQPAVSQSIDNYNYSHWRQHIYFVLCFTAGGEEGAGGGVKDEERREIFGELLPEKHVA